MGFQVIQALILQIALSVGVPPYFALSIAMEENSALSPGAIGVNRDGTLDRGVMQLNSSWYDGEWRDPEINILAGCLLIRELMAHPYTTTYWDVAICYNAGTRWIGGKSGPPASSVAYAGRVMARWDEYQPCRPVVLRGVK